MIQHSSHECSVQWMKWLFDSPAASLCRGGLILWHPSSKVNTLFLINKPPVVLIVAPIMCRTIAALILFITSPVVSAGDQFSLMGNVIEAHKMIRGGHFKHRCYLIFTGNLLINLWEISFGLKWQKHICSTRNFTMPVFVYFVWYCGQIIYRPALGQNVP